MLQKLLDRDLSGDEEISIWVSRLTLPPLASTANSLA